MLDDVLNPPFQLIELQDRGVGSCLFEVGIVNAVSVIGERNPSRIRPKLLHRAGKGEKAARALAHFLAVQHQVAVESNALWKKARCLFAFCSLGARFEEQELPNAGWG